MAQKLIRNIPDEAMHALEVIAAQSGKSTEAYIRDLIVNLTAAKTHWHVTYHGYSSVHSKTFKRTRLVDAPSAQEAVQIVKETEDDLIPERRITVEPVL